jgi:hypothetical protein
LTDEATLISDRNTFWDEIIRVVRQDFTNVFLRGLLYDHIGVADLDEITEVTVKSKSGVVGTMKTKTRTAIRQLSTNSSAKPVPDMHSFARCQPLLSLGRILTPTRFPSKAQSMAARQALPLRRFPPTRPRWPKPDQTRSPRYVAHADQIHGP